MPWTLIALACVFSSWFIHSFLDISALVAPVLKLALVTKILLTDSVYPWLMSILGAGKTLLLAAISGITSFVVSVLGGWKAWSGKKLFRHALRFGATLSARFVFVNVLLNLLFGDERKGLKKLPVLLRLKLRRSWAGRLMNYWKRASARTRRLLTGIALCTVLILVGHAVVGISILLFDLLWEIVLWCSRLLVRFWVVIRPIVLRLIPNTIGNFFANTVVPFLAEAIPVIRDDHRVLFMRFSLRRNYRLFKYWLYRHSRARRSKVRERLRPLVSESIRSRKVSLLNQAADIPEKKQEYH